MSKKEIKCAKCGACTSVCPVYQVTGRESHTARGRMHLLSRLNHLSSTTCGDIFSACLLCGACLDVCPRHIDTLLPIIKARETIPYQSQPHFFSKLLSRKALATPLLLEGLSSLRHAALKHLPPESGLRRKLALVPEDFPKNTSQAFLPLPENSPRLEPINYFSGCLSRHISPDISAATRLLAAHCGKLLDTPKSQTCCGLASYVGGSRHQARKIARKNIAAFTDNNLPILTSCASCFHHLQSYPALLADDPLWAEKAQNFSARLQECTPFFLEHLPYYLFPDLQKGKNNPHIFYHDPCHLRFGKEKITAPPRKLIQKVFSTPPLELPLGPHCCGQGGLFHLAHRDLSYRILNRALQQFMELAATHVVTTCSGCLLQWQQGLKHAGSTAQVKHLMVLIAEQLSRSNHSQK